MVKKKQITMIEGSHTEAEAEAKMAVIGKVIKEQLGLDEWMVLGISKKDPDNTIATGNLGYITMMQCARAMENMIRKAQGAIKQRVLKDNLKKVTPKIRKEMEEIIDEIE